MKFLLNSTLRYSHWHIIQHRKKFFYFFHLQCRLQKIFNRNRINSLGAEVLITFHQNYYLFLLLTIIYFLCCWSYDTFTNYEIFNKFRRTSE